MLWGTVMHRAVATRLWLGGAPSVNASGSVLVLVALNCHCPIRGSCKWPLRHPTHQDFQSDRVHHFLNELMTWRALNIYIQSCLHSQLYANGDISKYLTF